MQGQPAGEMPGGWPPQDHNDHHPEHAYGRHRANVHEHAWAPGHDHHGSLPRSDHDLTGSPPHARYDYHDGHNWQGPADSGGYRIDDGREAPQDANGVSDHNPQHPGHLDKASYRNEQVPPDIPLPEEGDTGAVGAGARLQPDMPAVHHHHYHAVPKKNKKGLGGNAQAKSRVKIANAQQPAPQAGGGGDNLSMLMMQQMMMQQMQAQQMQAQQMQTAQMAALAQAQMQRLSTGGGGAGSNGGAASQQANGRSRPATKVNIKSKKRKVKAKSAPKVRAVAVPAVVAPVQQQQTLGVASASALDNWQEATIILCIAIIGLIYLVSTRASESKDGKEEKKPSIAAKYMT